MTYYRNRDVAYLSRGRTDGRCCEEAAIVPCVCDVKWSCPQHGETCVGSHE